jgi:outer membrane protein assembly factor BamE (lipoprotein component of BamABCDE complex)
MTVGTLTLPWVALGALLATGCTIGRYYQNAPLRADPSVLVEGQSTKSDVLRQLGPPWLITHQTDGDAFVYMYDRQNWSTLRLQDPITGISWFTYSKQYERRDTVLVTFDFNGVVRGVAIDYRVEELPAL